MASSTIYEIIGYLASALVILSLTQKSILRLRLIGLVGSIVFLSYSLLIGAFPIAVVNVAAAAIHLHFLRRLVWRKSEVFSVLHVRPESKYLEYFLDFYNDDITNRFHPGFEYEPQSGQFAVFVLRDMVPAGLFIGRSHPDGSVEVIVDYAIPQYRDFKMGPYLYSPASELFSDRRCTHLWSVSTSDTHSEYLNRTGFSLSPTDDHPRRYSLEVESPELSTRS